MPRIKLTKSELKIQRDNLKRFTRFLPTLQLKKQQLQTETQYVKDEITGFLQEKEEFEKKLLAWVKLCCRSNFSDCAEIITAKETNMEIRNVAGVDVPFFKAQDFSVQICDFYETEPWFDDLIKAVKTLYSFEKQEEILQERFELLEQELRITNQRVNLFEKVMIPDAKENIRKIQIYMGDQQIAAVGRSKIAKRKLEAS
ncbi:MAG: V-type ATP synthase subunit D [Verrucomicrobiota bacterium]|nr:V-type ATP synthase subunit D [Verrucomicrobiota bacterium]